MDMLKKMVRETERADFESEDYMGQVKDALWAALNACPVHYSDAASARKLHVSKATIILMKQLAETLK